LLSLSTLFYGSSAADHYYH